MASCTYPRGNSCRCTLAKHFSGQVGLVLLEISTAALGDALRWEPSRGRRALSPSLRGARDRPSAASFRGCPRELNGSGRRAKGTMQLDSVLDVSEMRPSEAGAYAGRHVHRFPPLRTLRLHASASRHRLLRLLLVRVRQLPAGSIPGQMLLAAGASQASHIEVARRTKVRTIWK